MNISLRSKKLAMLFLVIAVALGISSGVASARGGTSDHDHSGKFKATLTGNEEVPAVTTDTMGTIRLSFNDDASEAAFKLRVWDGIAITQAHLHCAREGVNGPVVAFLWGQIPGGFHVDGKLAEFTLTDSNILPAGADCERAITDIASLKMAIEEGIVYANVHSVANPGGEVRAQLMAHPHHMNDTTNSTSSSASDDNHGMSGSGY